MCFKPSATEAGDQLGEILKHYEEKNVQFIIRTKDENAAIPFIHTVVSNMRCMILKVEKLGNIISVGSDSDNDKAGFNFTKSNINKVEVDDTFFPGEVSRIQAAYEVHCKDGTMIEIDVLE
ncbi:hypothetical protein M3221_23780 [Domibacillus indicus]|uniref:hypothetical protein n=1 Tax=Domibacillus indicus TaxID=1437523 RepID=UPI002041207D|nr:hypothetical protein [Domibacillus indicus]MCM3791354.1 hypothetical protein [Domibacillus indicus]